MKANPILSLVLLGALPAVSQNAPAAQARCKFPGGNTITVTYSSESKNYRMVIDESLVTVKGINVPAGNYTVYPVRDARNNWTLTMKSESGKDAELPPVPMSVSGRPLPAGSPAISFERTGGGCRMHWAPENANVLLSLEFTQKNGDVPVMQ